MNTPRFTISKLIALVAIAALDFAAIRLLAGLINVVDWAELLGVGALPMANVLAVSVLIGQRSLGRRPFLLGFVAFGVTALAMYIALLGFFSVAAVWPYLAPLLVPIEESVGRHRPSVLVPILYAVAVVMLGLPQVTFALIGGFLSRRYEITVKITKRPLRAN